MPTTEEKKNAKVVAGVDVGDPVHYVWPDSGHHHAAWIANVLDPERGYVTLSVLDHNGGFMQSPWVQFDPDGAPGTWHLKEAKDSADKLDPAGLNIEPGGRTGVPQGTQGEVDAGRSDAERAADARVPRLVAKDDPVGHRTADVAADTDTADRVDRSAFTETASERAAARAADGVRVSTEPAARNAANEPSAVRRAQLAAEEEASHRRTGTRAEPDRTAASRAESDRSSTTRTSTSSHDTPSATTGAHTGAQAADREANASTRTNAEKTDKS